MDEKIAEVELIPGLCLPRAASRWHGLLSELRDVPKIALVIVFALLLVALLAPMLAPYGANDGGLREKLLPPAFVTGGSMRHVLGTDTLGRDTLSRLILGARISLVISTIAILFAGAIGSAIGIVSGYFGGWVDRLLMMITDIGLAMPLVLVAIVMAAALGASFQNIIIVLMVLLWPRYARQVRAEVLAIKEQDFVLAARVAGRSPLPIMLHHIFPNVLPTLLVLATLQVGYVILLESSLSFLGVGVPPPQPAWGVMVADGSGLIASAWWVSLWPGMAMLLTVLALNILGDWVRDRFDPKLRQL
ncbi:MAG: ABC transporter permease [Chloroflexota bacterium]|nr:MAG: ABC transporter permease [Chloroflexota bacterium]